MVAQQHRQSKPVHRLWVCCFLKQIEFGIRSTENLRTRMFVDVQNFISWIAQCATLLFRRLQASTGAWYRHRRPKLPPPFSCRHSADLNISTRRSFYITVPTGGFVIGSIGPMQRDPETEQPSWATSAFTSCTAEAERLPERLRTCQGRDKTVTSTGLLTANFAAD